MLKITYIGREKEHLFFWDDTHNYSHYIDKWQSTKERSKSKIS